MHKIWSFDQFWSIETLFEKIFFENVLKGPFQPLCISRKEVQWTLVIVNSVLSPILFTNERCLLFSMFLTIAQFHQKCLLMRDCLLFRRLLLPESTACLFWILSKTQSFSCSPNSLKLISKLIRGLTKTRRYVSTSNRILLGIFLILNSFYFQRNNFISYKLYRDGGKYLLH